MAWIEFHQGLAQHHKTRRLKRVLGISVAQAVGHMAMLWTWALDAAPDGDLSAFDPIDIAEQLDWDGDPQVLLDGMALAGFLDKGDVGPVIHDWHEYGGKLTDKRRSDAERKRVSRGRPVDVRRTGADVHSPSVGRRGNSTVHDSTVPNHVHAHSDERALVVPFEEGPYPMASEDVAPKGAAKKRAAPRRAGPGRFDEWWQVYPRHIARKDAEVAWASLAPSDELIDRILTATMAQTQTDAWTRDGGAFIPYPATWLRAERWNDQLTTHGSNVVPISHKPQSVREAFLAFIHPKLPRTDDAYKLVLFCDRCKAVDKVEVDREGAAKVLADKGLDEALWWAQQQVMETQRKLAASG